MGRDLTAFGQGFRTALAASVLTASLLIAGAWWLDGRQAARQAQASHDAMTGTLMAGIATARGALEVANTSRENAERMHAMSLARTDRRGFTGLYAVQGLRLRRALWDAGAPQDAPMPIDLIPEVLLPALNTLHDCAIVARNRLRLPEGECLSVAVIARSMEACETAILIAMDDVVRDPADMPRLHDRARTDCLAQPGLPVSTDRPT